MQFLSDNAAAVHPRVWAAMQAADAADVPYDGDALTAYRQIPLVCVLPKTAEQVSAILSYATRENIRLVPRGAGTSLSGGALPLADGIVLSLTRMSRVLEIDIENRCIVVQPGVTNASVTRAVEAAGFYYAPDPSSQIACTIGGNIAENSGGIHCLKYGLTTHNLMGVELALLDGERVRLGGKHADDGGLGVGRVAQGTGATAHIADAAEGEATCLNFRGARIAVCTGKCDDV